MSDTIKNITHPLHNPADRLSLHLDQTPLAVIDWDTEFRVISWNKAAENIFGYSFEEAYGRLASELINPESIKEEIDEIGKKLLEKTVSTRSSNKNKRKDGKQIFCEWYNTAIVDNKGIVIGISSLVMDITDRKKEQNLLTEKDSLLKAFTSALPDVSFIYDEDGKYVEVLASEKHLLYAQSEVMLGKTIYDIFPEEFAKEIHKVIKETIISGKPQIYEYQLDLPSGETWFEARTSSMDIKINGKNTIVWLAHDITANKKADKKIQDLLFEKEIILKEVHHRIKNNMHVISSLLDIHSNKINNPDLDYAFQDAISRINNMGFLYDKLYKSENFETLGVKKYLLQLTEEVIQIFPAVKNIKLNQQIDDIELETAKIFPLGIIINEIFTNIMKYAFTGKDSGIIRFILEKNNSNIVLIIQDNGSGFPEGFDKEEQEGFGLSLIRMLVEQLDGSLKMENDNGAKTIIKFNI